MRTLDEPFAADRGDMAEVTMLYVLLCERAVTGPFSQDIYRAGLVYLRPPRLPSIMPPVTIAAQIMIAGGPNPTTIDIMFDLKTESNQSVLSKGRPVIRFEAAFTSADLKDKPLTRSLSFEFTGVTIEHAGIYTALVYYNEAEIGRTSFEILPPRDS